MSVFVSCMREQDCVCVYLEFQNVCSSRCTEYVVFSIYYNTILNRLQFLKFTYKHWTFTETLDSRGIEENCANQTLDRTRDMYGLLFTILLFLPFFSFLFSAILCELGFYGTSYTLIWRRRKKTKWRIIMKQNEKKWMCRVPRESDRWRKKGNQQERNRERM